MIQEYGSTCGNFCITYYFLDFVLKEYKAKAVLLNAKKALGGEEYSSCSFSTLAVDRVCGQSHAPDPPRVKVPRYPLYRRLGGPQSRSGHRSKRKTPFASAGDRIPVAR
jgi:hypothetical protein